jgi:L-aminopeptidase/D-esterase-like protein
MLEAFRIGHYTDAENGTGATVIVCEKGAVGGVSVRGAAPATRETDLLRDGKKVQEVNAVVLSGGSAFGLEAASGVAEYLFEQGFGYNAGKYRVPIVCGASLYDLEYKNFAYPHKENGYQAAKEAVANNFQKGSIGAGTGATVSKLAGMLCAAKAGLGVRTFCLNGLEIAVIVAVNALGDIVRDGSILLGAKTEDGRFLDCLKVFSAGSLSLQNQNTTIGCILTNAKLTKEQANILSSLGHDGYALSISPAHTMFDGDALFCMASGEVDAEFNMLTAIVPQLVASAVWSVAENGEIPHTAKKVNKFLFGIFKRMWKER